MKPFNLEAALRGEAVVTRDGRPVKIAGYNPDAAEDSRVAAWVVEKGTLLAYYTNGSFLESEPHIDDLFMAPVEVSEWVVRVPSTKEAAYNGPYQTEKEAQNFASRYEGSTVHEIKVQQ